jgi:hypothetical protein
MSREEMMPATSASTSRDLATSLGLLEMIRNVWIAPQFEAGAGRHAWLGASLFLGRGRLTGPKAIAYELYRVDPDGWNLNSSLLGRQGRPRADVRRYRPRRRQRTSLLVRQSCHTSNPCRACPVSAM